MQKLLSKLPRRSVLKAFLGVLIMFITLASIVMGYRGLGILFVFPVLVGGLLLKEYFIEIGLSK